MAKIQNLEVGDVVELVSGGPRMTVSLIPSPQTVQVMWFDEEDALKTAQLTIGSLKRSSSKGGK